VKPSGQDWNSIQVDWAFVFFGLIFLHSAVQRGATAPFLLRSDASSYMGDVSWLLKCSVQSLLILNKIGFCELKPGSCPCNCSIPSVFFFFLMNGYHLSRKRMEEPIPGLGCEISPALR